MLTVLNGGRGFMMATRDELPSVRISVYNDSGVWDVQGKVNKEEKKAVARRQLTISPPSSPSNMPYP